MQLAQMGLMAGAVDELIGAGAGLLSVNEAIKDVPGLARAANQAMGEFNKGVQQTASAALGEGVPALHALGAALGPLGQEVGRIGAEQMGTVLGGATELATTATGALQALEPAIGPALSGAINLGNAFLNGIASPAVVGAIKGVGESLQGANVAEGITTLTSGLLSAGGVVTQVAADAVGAAGGVLDALLGPGGSEAAAPAIAGGGVGALTLGKFFGGGLGGAGIAGALGASAIGFGSYQQQQGQDPTAGIISEAGGAALGMRAFGPVGALLGVGAQAADVAAQQVPGSGDAGNMIADIMAGAAIGSFGGPLGMAGGALVGGGYGIYQAIQDHANQTGGYTPGSISSGTGGGGAFPANTAAGKYGWTADAKGNLTPSNTPSGGGGTYAGGPSAQPYTPGSFQGSAAQQQAQPTLPDGSPMPAGPGDPGAPLSKMFNPFDDSKNPLSASINKALTAVTGIGEPPAPPPPIPPAAGPATTGGLLNPSQPSSAGVQPLPGASSIIAGHGTSATPISSQQLQQMNQALTQTAPAANTASQGLSQLPSRFSGAASSATQLQSSASGLTQPLAQVQQHAQAASTASQQLTESAPAAVASAAQITPAVNKAMTESSAAVASGGTAVGQSIPTSIGTGIAQNQSAACTAAQKLGDGTANCTKASVRAASPSKVFMEIGGWISQGLAIGIENSTPQAVGAIQSSMAQVVAAGQTSVNAASPSKTFQSYGEQAVKNVAQGATNIAPSVANEAQSRQQTLANQLQANLPQTPLANALFGSPEDQKNKKTPEQLQRDAYQKSISNYDQSAQSNIMKGYDQRQDRAKKQQADRDREQKKAMEGAGVGGLLDPTADNPLSQLSPHNQRALQLRDAAKARSQLGQEAAKQGISPQQLLNTQQNARLGAAPDTGKPSGIDPGQKNSGFGDPTKGQNNSGYEQGKNTADNMKKGIDDNADGPAGSAGKMADNVTDTVKKKHGVSSPSTVFQGIGSDLMSGLSLGVAGGSGSVSSGISDAIGGGVMGIASNTGLQVGYVYGESVVTGVTSVLKSADYQQVALPQIGSQLATAALGTAGLLPPSGSGGSIPNNQTVTLSGGTPAQQPITLNVMLDGQPFRELTVTSINAALNALADSIPQQVG
jgi:hypothetical protein